MEERTSFSSSFLTTETSPLPSPSERIPPFLSFLLFEKHFRALRFGSREIETPPFLSPFFFFYPRVKKKSNFAEKDESRRCEVTSRPSPFFFSPPGGKQLSSSFCCGRSPLIGCAILFPVVTTPRKTALPLLFPPM